MKKILIFSHEWPPYVGGVGTVGFQLAKWLALNDVDVTVVTRKQDNILSLAGVAIHQVNTLPIFWFLSYKKYFHDNINLDDFDFILLNECAPTISSAFFFKDEDFSKSMPIIHGLEVENIYTFKYENILRRMFGFKFFHEQACKKSKLLMFVGFFMRDKFLSVSEENLRSKSKVIYAGIDTSVFYYKSESLACTKLNLVSASRITIEKGYKEKFHLVSRLLRKNSDIIWHVCGDGDYLAELKQLVCEAGIEKNVIFYGVCTRVELNEIYSICDIYLLLSRYDEALPLCYLEAQLAGLYSIGYNKGGVVETISEASSGVLVDSPEDVDSIIDRYVTNRENFPSKELISSSAKKFDMNFTLNKLMDLL